MFLLLLAACGARESAAPAPAAAPAAASTAPCTSPTFPLGAPPTTRTAVATLEPRSGSTVTGTVIFTEKFDVQTDTAACTATVTRRYVDVAIDLAGATPGEHAVHVHEKGDCSAPDGTSAGGHYNPAGVQHGSPDAAEHHPGDFGNVTVGPDGTGHKTLQTSSFTLADGDVTVGGRGVIVHEKPDDFSQPVGNAGGRQACGVITVK